MKLGHYSLCCLMVSLLFFSNESKAIDFDIDNYKPQWSDSRSQSVGDIVTILINESARASSSAGISADNSRSLAAGFTTKKNDLKLALGLDSDVTGDASTQRNGAINATITARIIAKDKYGLFEIEGSQYVTVNGEEQKIILKGFIKPDDLSANNFISSSRIESAQIELSGIGEVNDNRNPGLFRSIFRWLSL